MALAEYLVSCLAEIWAIEQPGSLKIKRVYDAMDLFQVCRPVHSDVSSLSIPIGSGKVPLTLTATPSPAAEPHCLDEIWAIEQPG